jgi:hypothetical protein
MPKTGVVAAAQLLHSGIVMATIEVFKRPAGVTLIAAVQAVNAVTLGLQLIVADRDPSTPYNIPGDPGVVATAFVVLGLVTAAGLWFLQRWAWVTTMIWAGFALLVGLLALYRDQPVSYFTMAVTVIQVFYLNLTEVQEAFDHRYEAADG